MIRRYTNGLWCLREFVAFTIGIVLALATSSSAVAADDVPGPLAEAVGASLDGWSQFANTGDLSALESTFAIDGPQWRQFEFESAAGREQTSAEPLRLELGELRLRRLDATTATVWAEIKASRIGHVSEVFRWDFDLVRDDGRWFVWTVVEAIEPLSAVQIPAPAPSLTTTTTSVTVTEPEITADRLIASAGESSRGTRIPVLSAWIVVITLVGVALAGYLAPRIDRKGDG